MSGQEVGTGDRKVHTGFWWGDLSGRGHLEDMGVEGMIILQWTFKTWDCPGTGFIWLGIGGNGGFFLMQQ